MKTEQFSIPVGWGFICGNQRQYSSAYLTEKKINRIF